MYHEQIKFLKKIGKGWNRKEERKKKERKKDKYTKKDRRKHKQS